MWPLCISVMAGGDFALIKSVEGFEDFPDFGRHQLREAGVQKGDVVVAITEGGETPFVIGTAWEGLDRGPRSSSSTTIRPPCSASTSSVPDRSSKSPGSSSSI
jgi:N-acetylmuramic acid 6-phosphate (MurNAc-6-P) etherase